METVETLIQFGLTGAGIGIGLLVVLALFKQFLLIGKPNEVLVFSGRSRTLADGSEIGYREVLGGGWTWRWADRIRRRHTTVGDRHGLSGAGVRSSSGRGRSGLYRRGSGG